MTPPPRRSSGYLAAVALCNLTSVALCACGLAACGYFAAERDESPLLARVGDRELHASDVGDLVPAGTAPADSVNILRNYVVRWAREASVIIQAEASVGEDRAIDRLVDDYRASLQRHRLEEQLLTTGVDTVVDAALIQEVYDGMDDNLEAPHQLVRAYVLKAPSTHPRLGDLEAAWREAADGLVPPRLRQLADEVATLALLDARRWYEAPELELALPKGAGDIPTGSRVIEDGDAVYLVTVFESVRRGQKAPLSYIEPRLRKMILEQRRAAYLETYITKVYNDALQRDEVKIYVGTNP